MKKFILDLVFPIRCLGCGAEGDWLCPDCLGRLPVHGRTIIPTAPLDKLLVACDYRNPLIKKMVLDLKYNFIRDLAVPAGRLMGRRLNSALSRNILDTAILIPVPLHKKRLRWRGFNQAELLAKQVGQELNLPVANNILIRRRHAAPQAKINDALVRKENVKNSFALAPDYRDSPLSSNFSDKTVVLIDDISTTGATLCECARALVPLEPLRLWALVFAHG